MLLLVVKACARYSSYMFVANRHYSSSMVRNLIPFSQDLLALRHHRQIHDTPEKHHIHSYIKQERWPAPGRTNTTDGVDISTRNEQPRYTRTALIGARVTDCVLVLVLVACARCSSYTFFVNLRCGQEMLLIAQTPNTPAATNYRYYVHQARALARGRENKEGGSISTR